jgi:SAM-dependent methyltransferase
MEQTSNSMPPQNQHDDQERRFFYALREAPLYDRTIEWVCPYYSLLHDTLIRLVELHISRRPTGHEQDPYYVLDIGCGTGAESLTLLANFPFSKVVGIDLAGPMIDEYQKKLGERKIAADRFIPVVADILSESCKAECLRAFLPPDAQQTGFHAVTGNSQEITLIGPNDILILDDAPHSAPKELRGGSSAICRDWLGRAVLLAADGTSINGVNCLGKRRLHPGDTVTLAKSAGGQTWLFAGVSSVESPALEPQTDPVS